ncbi:hypothetical protein QJS04_geneDACA013427 [Acorus gramineus]|uniref:Uncharacterized protein n=1 Tax=Acorus gramineus TaxID=55184 RepID=A0AAV9AIN5_ACOGR|nr:hypothetical protein QJS04_geneDACA013427 [Acorus gramineus]
MSESSGVVGSVAPPMVEHGRDAKAIVKLSIEEIEPRLIELQQLGVRASAHTENEEETLEHNEEDLTGSGETSSDNDESNEKSEDNPSGEEEIDRELLNSEGGGDLIHSGWGDMNVCADSNNEDNQPVMEDDCGGQFGDSAIEHQSEGVQISNLSPDNVKKTLAMEALEEENTNLKITVAAHGIDMLRIMADNSSKSFRLKTSARNLDCLFKKCGLLRRKIRGLNQQIGKLKTVNSKLKKKVSVRDDDIKGYKDREKGYLSVIAKQKQIISDMEDNASVHDITQKTALDAEIMSLKELITEKENLIAQQSVMLDFLQTQHPSQEAKPLDVIPLNSYTPDIQYVEVDMGEATHEKKKQTRSMVRRIKMRDRKAPINPEFQYSDAGKGAKRVAIGVPQEKETKKQKFSFRIPKNNVAKALGQKDVKILRQIVDFEANFGKTPSKTTTTNPH